MMDKLKECPFCGSTVKIDEEDFYMFCCDKCGAGVTFAKVFEDGTAGDCSKEESITAWNRRATPENKPLTLEQLKRMDREPVWIQGSDTETSGWSIFKGNSQKQIANCPDDWNISYYLKDYGKAWLAYARKPEQEVAK
jgi:Lar family restriction alleviation protein